jgi:predicted AAA+ superfamily ATPase
LVQQHLRQAPAVVLLGRRQVGRTTLARDVAARHPGALVLDLERESDRAALERPELFFAAHRDRLLVLDEVQHLPRLFEALRPEIDLIVEHRARTVAVEVKFSSAPKPARGFWQALRDLHIEQAYVVAPVARRYPLAEGVDVLPLQELGALWA